MLSRARPLPPDAHLSEGGPERRQHLSPARVAGDERRIPHPFPIEVTGDEAPTPSGVWWADGERRSRIHSPLEVTDTKHPPLRGCLVGSLHPFPIEVTGDRGARCTQSLQG